MRDVLVSWSGGKDSAMALDEIVRAQGQYRVASLVTTLLEGAERVQIQNVSRALIERQAASLNLPLRFVYIPKGASNRVYEARLTEALTPFLDAGVDSIVFGDLFLEDIRAYREEFLGRLGLRGLFPLWQRDTRELIRQFIGLNFKALITSVDARALDASFAGRMVDEDFLAALPAHVDPCGENGEFHTFVFDGPLFQQQVRCQAGAVTLSDGHYFCDVMPLS